MSTQNSQQATKKILIARADSPNIYCPYADLAKRYKLVIDFRPFIRAAPISACSFRKFKQRILTHTAILFTNKIAINHFFNLAKVNNIYLPENTKYFCATQPLAHYLQKYVVVKKRKLFKGEKGFADLFTIIKKHKKENFLFLCSNISRKDIPAFFKQQGYKYTEIVIYKLLAHDLTDLVGSSYDIIVFFSPLEVKALTKNLPNFGLGHTKIATFGFQTAKAVEEAGWQSHIQAPRTGAPSMVEALNQYFKKLQ